MVKGKYASKKKIVKKVYRRKPTTLATVKTLVNRAIARNIENKSRQYFQNTPTLLYSANSGALLDGSIIPLTPAPGVLQIDQGLGAGGRVGNEIQIKNLMFKGTIVPSQHHATLNTSPQPLQVKMWLFYDKSDPSVKPIPAASQNFFQFNDSNIGFNNSIVDMWKPINTDVYRVLATKTFKLGNSINGSAGASAPASQWSNNDFKYNANFSINLTKYIVKTVKFNDNNSQPTTRGLYALFECMYADGTQIGSGQRVATIQYMIDCTYQDA